MITPAMALEGKGRLHQSEASRTLVYISQKVANDSAFPFASGDELVVRIDANKGRLVIEKARP